MSDCGPHALEAGSLPDPQATLADGHFLPQFIERENGDLDFSNVVLKLEASDAGVERAGEANHGVGSLIVNRRSALPFAHHQTRIAFQGAAVQQALV
jgi:hypothetical protein